MPAACAMARCRCSIVSLGVSSMVVVARVVVVGFGILVVAGCLVAGCSVRVVKVTAMVGASGPYGSGAKTAG